LADFALKMDRRFWTAGTGVNGEDGEAVTPGFVTSVSSCKKGFAKID
jgi:hypothetical protein